MIAADWPAYQYRGVVIRAVDGDNLVARLDLGLRVLTVVSLRIAGINAPERFTGTEETRALGKASWEHMQLWAGWSICVRTYKDKQTFNRYVADVYAVLDDGTLRDVAEDAIESGHAAWVGAT